MRELTLAELADLTGAAFPAESSALLVGPDVVTDSRLATPGALFVALPGERVDGHDFVDAAAAGGAAAVLATRSVAALPTLLVPDSLAAMSRLAREVVQGERARGLVTVAITGSSGKTTTKDLVAQVLAAAGATVSPPGSFNNEIGVPLTALRVGPDTRFLVSEMGARGIGHIAWLCSLVPPDIAAVLNVGHAHLGEFGSVEAIAEAKGEIVEALSPTGWAVLNADDAAVLGMAGRTSAQLACFSTRGEPSSGDLRVWAKEVEADELQRHRFVLTAAGSVNGSAAVQLTGSGAHHVANALAAAAIGLAAGVDLDRVAEALTAATAGSRWRMELRHREDGVLVVNDAYNANPDSMAAALQTVAGIQRRGRLIAVLGDMLELGEGTEEAHREIGRLAAQLGFEVIGVGELAVHLVAAAQAEGATAAALPDAAAAAASLRVGLAHGDVVLIKASRGLALDRVAQRLLDWPEPGGTS